MMHWFSPWACCCATSTSVILPVNSWRRANTACVSASRLGVSSGILASTLSNQRSRYACSSCRARVLAKACRVSSREITAAVAIWGSSIDGVIDHRLFLPYHSGVSQMPTRKNYVMHPYRHIEVLFTDTIDWELIETHWQDFMQVAWSIYTGRISSALLLRKLGHWSRKNRLYVAAQEVGRVKRTMYLLRWISDAALRSGVTAGTNSVEGYHALTKWMQFGGEGIITENDPDEQQKRARYLGLLTSALIFWNVAEMTRVIGDLVEEGYPVQQEDLAFLSPYLTRHIKRFGDYTLHTELTPGPIAYALDLARQRPATAIQITLPFLQEV